MLFRSTFPRGAGIVATYPSFVTGQTRVRPSFLTAAIDAGMRIEPRTQAPLLSSGEFGFSDRIVGRYPIDNFGNSATIAERNRLVQNYGSNIGEIRMDLQDLEGQGFVRSSYSTRSGINFHPDLQYNTYSALYGRTLHLDEVKAQAILGAGPRSLELAELNNYGAVLSEINEGSAIYRYAGNAFRVAGGLAMAGGTAYDIWDNIRIAEEYGFGSYESNSALARSVPTELGTWGSLLYGGYRGLASGGGFLSAAEVGLGLFNRWSGPAAIAGSVMQVGYGFYQDNWSWDGAHFKEALNNNKYELGGAAIGAGIGLYFGGIGALPGAGLGYAGGWLVHTAIDSYNYFFGTKDPFDWSKVNTLDFGSASQLAGFGLSLTSGLGGGGYGSGAIYDFTPGQTTNSVFDFSAYDSPNYSPYYSYYGNGYADYRTYNFSNVENYNYGARF